MKAKDIKEIGKENREKKMKELKLELIKSQANASKSGCAKTKNIKKIIARMLTINNLENKSEELKHK